MIQTKTLPDPLPLLLKGVALGLLCQLCAYCIALAVLWMTRGWGTWALLLVLAGYGLSLWSFVTPVRAWLKRRGQLKSDQGLFWCSIAGTIWGVVVLPISVWWKTGRLL